MDEQNNGQPKKKIQIFLPLILSLVMILGMMIGFKLQETSSEKINISSAGNHNSKINDLFQYIDAKYVDTVNGEQLKESAIVGVLKKLDPHSAYIPARELKAVNQSLEGNFEGIGIEFFIVDDTITVVTPLSGGPSEALGILAGDKIIKIDDKNVAGTGIKNEDVVSKLRGDKGTKVKVSILRSGSRDLIVYTITRDKIPIYSIDAAYMVDNELGYIRINRFSATTYEEFMRSLEKLKTAGITKLILDLRGNPGGYLNAAIGIADEFLENKKLIVYTQGHSYPRYDYYARSDGLFEKGDLAVLIDQGSASASEIVSGAVQDWDRGIVLGRRSFGKGLVQEQYTLPDSSALRLTVARYYTPSGRCIQRPYKDGFEKYYEEIDERFLHGEFQNADSIHQQDTVKYFTSKGRVVYGGGGIIPDIFVPLDTAGNSSYLRELFAKGIIAQFAYHYVGNHKADLEKYKNSVEFAKNFSIDEKMMKEFIDYAEQHSVPFDENGFKKSKTILIVRLKAYMAQQVWKSEDQYPVLQQIDNAFQKAYQVLKKEDGK